jgi:ABC-2 type transport system permease protein
VRAGFSFSCLSFFALAMLLAGILPNTRVATVVGNLVLYPMVYLSGATIPAQMLPDAVRNVARFLPLTHTVTLLQGLWKGDAWSLHQTELVVLLAMMVVASIIAVRAFRWE